MSDQKSLEDIIRGVEKSLPFGTVSLTFKRNHDLSTTIDVTKISKRKVKDSAQALTLIGSMLKMLAENKETGQLTFTVALKDGHSTEIMVHDFARRNIDMQTGDYK